MVNLLDTIEILGIFKNTSHPYPGIDLISKDPPKYLAYTCDMGNPNPNPA